MTSGLNQPGTPFKAQRNPSLFSYEAALQREAEIGYELVNVITQTVTKESALFCTESLIPKNSLK